MAEDAREDWLLQQVAMAFKAVTAVTPEKFNAFFRAEKTVGALDQFLNGGECNALFFYLDKATLSISMVPPKGGVSFLFAVKLEKKPVSPAGYRDEVIVGEMAKEALGNLARVTQDVFVPLLDSGKSTTGSEMVAKEAMESLNGFIANVQIMEGQVRGMTFLPLPPDKDMIDPAEEAPAAGAEAGALGMVANLPTGRTTMMAANSATGQKDRIHVLEGTLITWTKQARARPSAAAAQPVSRARAPSPSRG